MSGGMSGCGLHRARVWPEVRFQADVIAQPLERTSRK